jgi:hypothetical protein
MKITLSDGRVIKRRFVHGCTGYRAKAIEIDAADVMDMYRLLHVDPEELDACLIQLKHRWSA